MREEKSGLPLPSRPPLVGLTRPVDLPPRPPSLQFKGKVFSFSRHPRAFTGIPPKNPCRMVGWVRCRQRWVLSLIRGRRLHPGPAAAGEPSRRASPPWSQSSHSSSLALLGARAGQGAGALWGPHGPAGGPPADPSRLPGGPIPHSPLFVRLSGHSVESGRKKIIRWKSEIRRGALAASARPGQHSAGAS